MKRFISLICLLTFLANALPVYSLTVKENLELTLTPVNVTSTEYISTYDIPAVIKDDVFYKGVKVFKSGDKAILKIADHDRNGAWGKGGRLFLSGGYAYDSKGNKVKISFTRQIKGEDKRWVIGVCAVGIVFIPLLLFGFIKGENAKLTPMHEINAITSNSFEF